MIINHDPNVTDWIIAVSTALGVVATLILASVALFQEQFRSWLSRPKLDATIEMDAPDCVAIPLTAMTQVGQISANTYYFRIRVWNRGNASARQVEVVGTQLRQKTAAGTWLMVTSFLPMNFVWSNTGPGRVILYPQIMPGMFKHCDIGHVIDPAQRGTFNEENPALRLQHAVISFAFDQTIQPNNFAHIIGPGDYELDVVLAAANAPLARRTLSLSFVGNWYSDKTEMLTRGIGITIASS